MISVIVPYFNNESTIYRCIDSIMSNELISEIIVVDDGSLIALPPIQGVKVVRKTNGGVSTARNFGVNLSTSKYVAFCDADDMWLPGKTINQLNVMNKKMLRIIASLRDTSNKNNIFRANSDDLTMSKTMMNTLLQWDPHISTVIIERKLFLEVGGFDESMRRGEDCEFYMRVLKFTNEIKMLNMSFCAQINEKRSFGQSGLSANLKKMYLGELEILMRCRKNISYISYMALYCYYYLRYVRRILITKINNPKRKVDELN